MLKRVIITTTNNLVFDNRVHKVSVSLQKMGFEVWQTGRDYPRQAMPPGRVGRSFRFRLPFNKGPFFYLTLNVRLFFFLLQHRHHLIWAVDMDTLAAARLAGALKKVPVVFDGHEFFSEVPELYHRPRKKRVWRFLERWLIPGTSVRFTVSPGLVALYKKQYNADFLLLRNLPLQRVRIPVPEARHNSRTVIYQGALNTGRGLEQTIRAIRLLPGYSFLIVGQGDCMSALQSLTRELELEKRVLFKGAVPFERLAKLTGKAMAGMCLLENRGLNYYHSLPNRIFDYMQQGLPVIASGFPDIREVVEAHQTGLLVEELSPRIIAENIRRACEDAALRKLWQRTIPTAAAHFVWEKEEHRLREGLSGML